MNILFWNCPVDKTSICIKLVLTHRGRVTHICVNKITIIDSDNGLSPSRHQAIIWTNVGKLLIGPLGTNFSEILIEIHTSSFKKLHLKMSSGKRRPFCLSLNVLRWPYTVVEVYNMIGISEILTMDACSITHLWGEDVLCVLWVCRMSYICIFVIVCLLVCLMIRLHCTLCTGSHGLYFAMSCCC